MAQRDPQVAVIIPALNEAATIARVIATITQAATPISELIVMDSGSSDDTVAVAERAGARVVHREQVLPSIAVQPGKGEVLWRAVACSTAEFIVFCDADVTNPQASWVDALIAPLLTDPQVQLVKAQYERSLDGRSGEGGRVTQLVAKPLLHHCAPDLDWLSQPLAGEYAIRREAAEALPFAPRYGVELGLVIDVWQRFGAAALAQADLGSRQHRNRPLRELAVMSEDILAAALPRIGVGELSAQERPPLRELCGWRGSGAAAADPAITLPDRTITAATDLEELCRS